MEPFTAKSWRWRIIPHSILTIIANSRPISGATARSPTVSSPDLLLKPFSLQRHWRKASSVKKICSIVNGQISYAGKVIHDTHRMAGLSFAKILQVSSNIGFTKVAQKLKKDRYYRYIENLASARSRGSTCREKCPGFCAGPRAGRRLTWRHTPLDRASRRRRYKW